MKIKISLLSTWDRYVDSRKKLQRTMGYEDQKTRSSFELETTPGNLLTCSGLMDRLTLILITGLVFDRVLFQCMANRNECPKWLI